MFAAEHPKRIAIFASGAGTNAEKIIRHFSSKISDRIKVELIVCNKPLAGVLQVAERERVPTLLIERQKFFEDGYVNDLRERNIDFIVLAGFLWKLPSILIQSYPKKIINIHPALLPKFGGTGMFGSKVHETAIHSKEKQSGITIHYVDELYDHGEIIFQAACDIDVNETPESLSKKIHQLEHEHYPIILESLLLPCEK